MSVENAQRLTQLKEFLRGIQRPGVSLDSVTADDDLVRSGLIDSLAIVQIVTYLEKNYNIDFSLHGFDPDRLATMTNILHFIEETRV